METVEPNVRVWKDIFRPGTYYDKSGVGHTFTNADIYRAEANGNQMIQANRSAPAVWEHDWTSVPTLLSEFHRTVSQDRDKRADHARHTFGWATKYQVRKESGKPVLYAEVEIPSAEDAEQWSKTRYCSPRVDYDYTDSTGTTWPGACISHIAATNDPVQRDQKPVFLGGKPSTKTVFLGGTDQMNMKKIIAALARLGVTLPASVTTPEQMELALDVIAEERGAMDEPVISPGDGMDGGMDDPSGLDDMPADVEVEDDEEEDEDEAQMGGAGATQAATSGMAMLSQLPMELQTYVSNSNNALTTATNIHRKAILKRFARVEASAVEKGIITPAEAGSFKRRLTGVNLSFTASGNLQENAALRELTLIERACGKAGKTKKGKPKTVQLSGVPGGPWSREPQPGTAEFEAAVKAKAKQAGDRVTGTQS